MDKETTRVVQSRALGKSDTLALGINGVIGSGIFFLPSVGHKLLGPAAILSTLLAGVLAWMIASAFGSVAKGYSKNGGAYLYTRDHFGNWPGFVVGWMTWLVAVTSWGALLNALFLALGGLFSAVAEPGVKELGMTVLVALLVWVNIRGLTLGARFSTILTLLKATPLILLAILGFSDIEMTRFETFAPMGFNGFADATLLILYAYVGFESLVVPASEISDAKSTLPRILPGLIVGVTILYLMLQTLCIGTLDGLADRANPISDAASLALGDTVGVAFLWVSVVSVLGVNAGTALVTPRRLAALSEQGEAPRVLSRLHSRYGTPSYSIALTGGAALFFALSGSFKELALLSVVARFVQYLPTCWIAMVGALRPENRDPALAFKAGIALLVSVALLMASDPSKLVAGALGITVLSLAYLVFSRSRYSR
ncbi:MAG: APC family permease [Myxococcota bacterium]|nr:APC family permease [Myxococcota bacterium]